MQQPPSPRARQSFFRRLLFPYSGEEPLTGRQALRVILAWALPIPLSMALCTLALSALLAYTAYQTLLLVVLAFLSGLVVFGVLGWVVVSINNRAANIRQERRTRGTSNTSNNQWR
ncbi:MAG TPA: hypothetical protein VKV40_08860 [Ktedonobacteraceae bacterium]|nr:hypothetical protein [Ktedonobacteraceae bacterium]